MNNPTVTPIWPITRPQQKRFLLLSPDASTLLTELKQVLLPQGHSVSQAHNIADAFDMLAILRFDLLLLDSCLLHHNAVTAEQIATLVHTAQTAILIIQSETNIDANIKISWLNISGVSAWLEQSSLTTGLLAEIEYCLQHGRLLTAPPKQTNTAVLLDEQVLKRIAHNTTDDLFPVFLLEFTQEVQQRQQHISAFFQQQNWLKLRYEAHALKGLAGNFGAMQLYELAAQLEHHAHQLNDTALANLVNQMNYLAEQTCAAVKTYLAEQQ